MITFLDAAPQQQSALPSILMIVGLFVIMYFFMIRPQRKQQKALEKFRNALTVGMDVVTTAGIHGTIKAVGDTTVTLKVDTSVEIVFDKSAIVAASK